MDYPLKPWQGILRDHACFFFGHKLKWSPSKHTKYYDMDPSEVPYGLHKATGNALFESVAWWESKCVRCRQKFRKNATHIVWHQKQRGALRWAWNEMWWHLKYGFTDEQVKLPWTLGAFVIPMAFISGLKHYFAYFENIPSCWWTYLMDLEYWYYSKIDGD